MKREQLIASAFSYQEYVGGLGDALLRLYFAGELWYKQLENLPPHGHAVVSLMCHNPYLAELFKWHPKRSRIHVIDLGFSTPFHPWENREWRVSNGLPPEGPCPPYSPSKTLKFYPSPSDRKLLDELCGQKFVVLSATASNVQKSVPAQIRQAMATAALSMGFKVLVVGRRYYFKDGRANDIELVPGVIDAVDKLTVPGTIEAVKMSHGVLTAHSAVLHMAWSEKRPVFLLYDETTGNQVLPGGAVGYMAGMNRPDTDHMQFSGYSQDRVREWLRKR